MNSNFTECSLCFNYTRTSKNIYPFYKFFYTVHSYSVNFYRDALDFFSMHSSSFNWWFKTKYFSLQYIFQTHTKQTALKLQWLFQDYCFVLTAVRSITEWEAKLRPIQNRHKKKKKERMGKRLHNDILCIHKQVKCTLCADALQIFCCRTKSSWLLEAGRPPSTQTHCHHFSKKSLKLGGGNSTTFCLWRF